MSESPPRRLTRSTSDRRICGVAGGIGHYLGVDPVLIRIAFVVLALAGGSGLLAYAVAWLVLPEDDEVVDGPGKAAPSMEPRTVGGVILVVIGAIALFGRGWWLDDLGFPLILVAGGAWLLLKPERGAADVDAAPDPPTPPEPPAPASEQPAPAPPEPTLVGAAPGSTSTASLPRTTARSTRPPRPSGPPTGRIALGALIILAGIAGLTSGGGISVEGWLLFALAISTLGLLIGTFTGRARGLIVVSVLLCCALSVTALDAIPVHGSIGDRRYRPDTVAEIQPRYEHGIGGIVIDLSGVPSEELPRRTTVEISVGLGDLQVFVPDDVRVEVTASVTGGDLRLFGENQEGTGIEASAVQDAPEGAPVLVLDIELGLGQVDVR